MPALLMKEEFATAVLGFPATLVTREDRGPIRPILNGRRSKPVWNYYSLKNGFSLPCESGNELRALYHAEVSTDVVRYRVQPHTVRFVIGGRVREYTPDLEETLSDGRVVITEVKDTFEEADDPEYSEKLGFARAFYNAQGVLFRIRERTEIEARPVFDSVEAVQTFRRTMITAEDVLLVRAAFAGRESARLAEIRDNFKTAALGFAKLSAMMVRRIVAIDLTRGLEPDSSIHLLKHR